MKNIFIFEYSKVKILNNIKYDYVIGRDRIKLLKIKMMYRVRKCVY